MWKIPKQKHGKARIPLDSDSRTQVLKKGPHGDLKDLGNPQKRPVFHYLSVFFFSSLFRLKMIENWVHYKKEIRTRNDQQNGPFGHLCRSLKSSYLFCRGSPGGVGVAFDVDFLQFVCAWSIIF